MSTIIVCDEKHGPMYWDASTPEAFAESALAILTWRWRDGYWYHDPDDGLGDSDWAQKQRAERAKALGITKEQFTELPETAQKEILALRKRARRDSQHDRQHRDWYARAKRVVEEQDTGTVTVGRNRYAHEEPEAWVLLDERSDHQYERVELVDLWDAERYREREAS